MSFFSALPITALPVAEGFVVTAATVARPLLGLGVLAGLAVVFRPLLTGLARAALLVVSPRKSVAERNARRLAASVRSVNILARRFEAHQPNLAAELRWLASRAS